MMIIVEKNLLILYFRAFAKREELRWDILYLICIKKNKLAKQY